MNILSNNTFAYCRNTPINFSDPSGKAPGDPFEAMDEAAEDCMEYIGQDSIDQEVEFYSVIYKLNNNGNIMYSYTYPEAGGQTSSVGVIKLSLRQTKQS